MVLLTLLPIFQKALKKGTQLMILSDEANGASKGISNSQGDIHEEPVRLILSAADSGINLFGVDFQPDLMSDESLLSGFLTALRCISHEIFWTSFDEIRFGRYTMLMKVHAPFLFAYIFSGHTSDAMHRLDEFIKILRERSSLLRSLKNTIKTGAVDKMAQSSIWKIASQVFSNFG